MGNYNVKINEKKGTCNTSLFEKMAQNGDITSTKLADVIGQLVHITGYADCTIETADKTFDILYFDTEEYGIISAGSEIFKTSLKMYYEEQPVMRLIEVKTKKGKTYKAVPSLKAESQTNNEQTNETTNEKLPF